MASVDVVNARKAYGGVEVIHGVSLSIADGEFVTLVGPSGCGKSTLLRMIAGLESITEGKVKIGPRVVNNLPPRDRDIAMVFQNYALYPHKTVEQNMSFGLKLRNTPKDEIQAPVRPARRYPPCRSLSFPLPAAIIGRTTAACRDGAGDRARSAGLSVRRAALKFGRSVARTDARRNQGTASAPEDHDHLCHP